VPSSSGMKARYATDLDGTRLYGCDLVTLDGDGHVLLGDPCVGGLADEDSSGMDHALVRAEHGFEGGR
jgi:hypothetical protein